MCVCECKFYEHRSALTVLLDADSVLFFFVLHLVFVLFGDVFGTFGF